MGHNNMTLFAEKTKNNLLDLWRHWTNGLD